MIEKKIILAHQSIAWYDMFSSRKKEKNELSFLDREDFDFLLEG